MRGCEGSSRTSRRWRAREGMLGGRREMTRVKLEHLRDGHRVLGRGACTRRVGGGDRHSHGRACRFWSPEPKCDTQACSGERSAADVLSPVRLLIVKKLRCAVIPLKTAPATRECGKTSFRMERAHTRGQGAPSTRSARFLVAICHSRGTSSCVLSFCPA